MAECPTTRASIQSIMKFSLTLPIILSSLYFSFSQAGVTVPTCAVNCAIAAGQIAGCDPTTLDCLCNNDVFIQNAAQCLLSTCSPADAQTAANEWTSVCGASSAWATY